MCLRPDNGRARLFRHALGCPGRPRAGLGRFLVDRAEQHCIDLDARVMDLVVVNLRVELQPWYERLGCRVTGTAPFEVPGKLKQPAHFIKMSKDLGPPSGP